jgi:hypothetical protein
MSATNVLWVSPSCDQMLAVFTFVLKNYDKGKVAKTRKWIDPTTHRVEDKPTCYAHNFMFKPLELKYLCNVMQALEPKATITDDLVKLRDNLSTSGVLKPGGKYQVTLVYYEQDYQLITQALTKAKTGKAVKLDEIVEGQRKEGKELFEV